MNNRSSGKVKIQGYVCPWWMISTFDNPLRRLMQKPEVILGGLIPPGGRCLDIGCGFGYYTLGMAELAGIGGHVTAVDIQQKMIDGTKRRVRKRGLTDRVDFHLSNASTLDMEGGFDFALAFWMMHEVKDQAGFATNVYNLLKHGGHFLLVEPKIHVNKPSFLHSVDLLVNAGFVMAGTRNVFFSRSQVFRKE